jgi:hypothetical protein
MDTTVAAALSLFPLSTPHRFCIPRSAGFCGAGTADPFLESDETLGVTGVIDTC